MTLDPYNVQEYFMTLDNVATSFITSHHVGRHVKYHVL